MLALLALSIGRRTGQPAVAAGVAGGLLFSIGDISTKLATQGGARFAFIVTLILGYGLGTALLQLGYQRGGALTVAGLATLLTNALPIAAGTIVLKEPVPSGFLGLLRVLAFAAVTAGAILLAAPDHSPDQARGRPPSSRRCQGSATRSQGAGRRSDSAWPRQSVRSRRGPSRHRGQPARAKRVDSRVGRRWA